MEYKNKMKILVTGAKGFVGRNLVAQLLNIKLGKANNYGLSDDITVYEYDNLHFCRFSVVGII